MTYEEAINFYKAKAPYFTSGAYNRITELYAAYIERYSVITKFKIKNLVHSYCEMKIQSKHYTDYINNREINSNDYTYPFSQTVFSYKNYEEIKNDSLSYDAFEMHKKRFIDRYLYFRWCCAILKRD